MKAAYTHSEPVHDGFTTKEKIYYTLAGMLILGGAFFVGRSIVRKAVSTSEEKKTFIEGDPATTAKLVKMAFENDGSFGTDLETLRRVVREIPSKVEFKKVIDAYQMLYNKSMMADMQSELETSEFKEMLAIIATKPARGTTPIALQLTAPQYLAWAKRLKAAFDKTYWVFPGTDEDAIKAVFQEIPTQAAFQQVVVAYQKEFARDMMYDLKHELEFWEYGPYMDIINKK